MTRPSPPPRRSRRKAFLVGLALPGQIPGEADEHLDELGALADTAGADSVGRAIQARPAPDPKYFLGHGKAETVAAEVARLGADLVLVDDDLSGSQAKNLAELVKVELLDRSGLILEIFERRAKSAEARTQVELARSKYELPRLTRMWGHLSRQKGGIGMRGGEGESQLEADRRMLRRKIVRLERDLARIEKMRKVQRAGRRGIPVVALAGYTNAGKSTLFNRLTRDGTLAEDRLFATLDSKLRKGVLGAGGAAVVFADTVGFIRKLPHHLVASFRSTLEEVVAADLVLHVVDRAHPRWEEQETVAREVMKELGVDAAKIVTVFNKIDLVSGPAAIPSDVLAISAMSGEGVAALKSAVARRLGLEPGPRPYHRTVETLEPEEIDADEIEVANPR